MARLILHKYDPCLQPGRWEFDSPMLLVDNAQNLACDELVQMMQYLVKLSSRPFFFLEIVDDYRLKPDQTEALQSISFVPIDGGFMYPYVASMEMINADHFRKKRKP